MSMGDTTDCVHGHPLFDLQVALLNHTSCWEKMGLNECLLSIRFVRKLRNQIRDDAVQLAAEQAAAMQKQKMKMQAKTPKPEKNVNAIF